MSTRCLIGNGHYIYCHFDGYPAGVGKILSENYTKEESVDALMALGSISSLGDTPETTVAYHRDLGEPLEKAELCLFPEYKKSIDFTYDFKNGKWYYQANLYGKMTEQVVE